MPIFEILVLVVAVIATIMSVSIASNTNKRLNRLRKRYDYLLRGRGEVSIEELLVQFGSELEQFKSQNLEAHDKMNRIEAWIQKTDTDQTAAIDEKFQRVSKQVLGQLDQTSAQMMSNMKRLDEVVFAQMDQVDKENRKAVEEQTNRIEELSAYSKEQLKYYHAQASDSLQKLDGRLSQQMNQLEGSTKQALQEVTEELNRRQETMQNQLNQKLTKLGQDSAENLRRETGLLKDQLYLAIQKVALVRYDAFEDLTGELSYSLCMLDMHRNGVMLTTIYARHSSNTFAKEIRNGGASRALSPEEEKALALALQQ